MKINKRLTETQMKRRKLLLILPLLVLPFVTLAFWALGGGHGSAGAGHETDKGVNSAVPRPGHLVRSQDKMSLYAAAEQQAEASKGKKNTVFNELSYLDSTYNRAHRDGGLSFLGPAGDIDANSQKAEEKLADLQQVMERARTAVHGGMSAVKAIDPTTYGLQPGEAPLSGQQMQPAGRLDSEQGLRQLDHFNEMIKQAAGSKEDNGGVMDLETRQINKMLDKILMIQHPEKTADSLRAISRKNKGVVYPVRQLSEAIQVPLLLPAIATPGSAISGRARMPAYLNVEASAVKDCTAHHPVNYNSDLRGAFYDIEPEQLEDDVSGVLSAVIAETQTLVSGSTVKIRLKEDLLVNGQRVPKGNFIYGSCSLNGERLKVEVRSIRYGKRLLPVDLAVYDLDGIEGIRMPGGVGRDAMKQGADQALSGVRMLSLDPGAAAQAATAGIEAAKGLLSKKVKLKRVTVKSGYPILLVDAGSFQHQLR